MNKHRNLQGRISFPEMLLLILSAVILMASGVAHAWLKNTQVEIVHDVDKTQKRIGDHEDSINSLQVKIEKKLNICVLRYNLENADSKLTVVPVSALEIIPPHDLEKIAPPRGDPATLAQRRP